LLTKEKDLKDIQKKLENIKEELIIEKINEEIGLKEQKILEKENIHLRHKEIAFLEKNFIINKNDDSIQRKDDDDNKRNEEIYERILFTKELCKKDSDSNENMLTIKFLEVDEKSSVFINGVGFIIKNPRNFSYEYPLPWIGIGLMQNENEINENIVGWIFRSYEFFTEKEKIKIIVGNTLSIKFDSKNGCVRVFQNDLYQGCLKTGLDLSKNYRFFIEFPCCPLKKIKLI